MLVYSHCPTQHRLTEGDRSTKEICMQNMFARQAYSSNRIDPHAQIEKKPRFVERETFVFFTDTSNLSSVLALTRVTLELYFTYWSKHCY